MRATVHQPMLIALLVGLLSGVVSSGLLQGLFFSEVELGGERFGIQTFLTLSAGAAFAVIGTAFLRWRYQLVTPAVILCVGASIMGMFLATEAAFWTVIITDGPNNASVLPAYIVGSLVGATILSGAVAWATRTGQAKRIIGHGVLWPTLWAAAVGAYITMDPNRDLVAWPNDMLLFCGWQAAFLGALTQAMRAR